MSTAARQPAPSRQAKSQKQSPRKNTKTVKQAKNGKSQSRVQQNPQKEEQRKDILRTDRRSYGRTDNTASAPVKSEPGFVPSSSSRPSGGRKSSPLKIIPLGGLNEIGKNIYLYECCNDMFIVDCGLAFPDDDMLGIDLVIPDFTYIIKNKDKLRGVVLTHGHEDHIGSLAYLLKKVNVPVYGTRLTLGLVEGKLKEHGILSQCTLNVVQPRQTVKMGCMAVEFIRVNHSIPDSCGFAIYTPAGIVIHTGDFKVDYTPIEGGIIDLARFGELGNRGVLALLSESTNAERPGFTMSERRVGATFRNFFSNAEGKRIIVATFSSNIHRIQQIIDNAEMTGRKVAVSGRSMINVLNTAIELNYIRLPKGILVDIEKIGKIPPDELVIITTGSQGEPMSALSRMANNEHRQVTITPQDLIIISANPIPGNEKLVGRVVNELMKAGANVVYEAMYDVHVSGHACQEELKMMLSLTRPKFFIPIHGEYKHMFKHAELAKQLHIPEENIFIAGNGTVIETDGIDMKITGQVPAGRVLIDGLGVGDVGSVVLRDRKHLAQDGLIIVVAAVEKSTGRIVSGPDLVSRGFVYVRESEELMDEARERARSVMLKSLAPNMREWSGVKSDVKDALSGFIFSKTGRSPMILP
ncbi:MAG TPA: RNase J family beta-CASP ribonuclease, partial [Ruminococcaceae bacterium]|nr:RNase J family beta-CASP ribonuclease [Oscillospiraceae bacterium]